MNGSEILKRELEAIREELIQKHIQLKMKASGDWIDSVEVQVEGLSGRVRANAYTEQLVNGRQPGKFPPIKMIEAWIYHKGINTLERNMTISSLAFLIARKIAREGTEYFKQGGTDLVDAVITPERIQSIIDKVSEFHVNRVVSEVTGFFEELKAA